ncbi:Beta-1,3-galactosyltransferase 5 [Armadillidium vulgare]|nr:Beta-1,3-galactosyltransferase 5 [Armadillidium vulgare]
MWGAAEWRRVTRYRLVMFLGQSLNESVNQRILIENELYGDIIQLDFIDSYENLTLKVLSGFHWISNFCSNAEWVLKSDSDVIVNIFSITKFLKNYDRVSRNSHDEILCKPKASHELLPFRHLGRNKWNVMYEEYPFDAYPPHCLWSSVFHSKNSRRAMEKGLPKSGGRK